MADAVRRGGSSQSTRKCDVTASKLVQLAAFLQLCRHKRLLPDDICTISLNSAIELITNRWGQTLLSPHGDGCDELLEAIDQRVWQNAFSNLADIEGPPEILAHIHLRLLGRRLADDGQGGFLSIPQRDTRKSGGIFYTPDYVTQYMVEQAISMTNQEIPSTLDPSCGCGAFLIAAFRGMIARRVLDAGNIDVNLEIMQSIHGVDIDPQAVLVARRILWLEMLSETCSTVAPDSERIAADSLAQTVRVGNTLADDFQKKLPDSFSTFDIIVGNPPYRRELGTKSLLDQVAASDLGRRWRTARMDLWYYFVHRGLELLAKGGTLSFIVSGYWTSGHGAEKLLDQLRRETHIAEIFDLGNRNVFAGVSGRHMIFRIEKGRTDKPTTVKRAAVDQSQNSDGTARSLLDGTAELTVYEKTAGQLFRQGRIDVEPPRDELLERISRGTPLGELGKVRQGIAENPSTINRRTNLKFNNRWTIGDGVFALSEAELASLQLPDNELSIIRPYHDLCDLGRYYLAKTPSRYLIYSTSDTWPEFEMHPVLGRHLKRFRCLMENRRETHSGRRAWWQLHWPRDESLWQSAKIISVQMASRPAFVPSHEPVYVPFSANVFVPDECVQEHLYYFAAVLNSSLLWQWYRHHAKRRGVGLEINGRILSKTPIRRIDFDLAADRDSHDRLVDLVDQVLDLSGKDEGSELLEQLDQKIDAIVCNLYGVCEII